MEEPFLYELIQKHRNRVEKITLLINVKLADQFSTKEEMRVLFTFQATLNSQLRALLVAYNGEDVMIEKFDEMVYLLHLGYLLYEKDIDTSPFEF